VGQVLPFLSQEHQQQVATAVERAKQVTMGELNSVIGVSTTQFFVNCSSSSQVLSKLRSFNNIAVVVKNRARLSYFYVSFVCFFLLLALMEKTIFFNGCCQQYSSCKGIRIAESF
jgi:hypothetical protein